MINLVTVESGWILQKLAERVASEYPDDIKVTHKADNEVTANFYMDIQNCFFKKSKTIDIGFFTHLDLNDSSKINPVWKELDFIFHQADRYLELFVDEGFSREKMATNPPIYLDERFTLKQPVLGIFQRAAFGKGESFLLKLITDYPELVTLYRWLFVGKGWDRVIQIMNQKNISVAYFNDESYEKYNSLYESIDYLLVPSLYEGGPMAVVEASSKGIPIISSDVGFVDLFDIDYKYSPGNIQELRFILALIIDRLYSKRKQVEKYSLKQYADKLITKVKELHDKKNMDSHNINIRSRRKNKP